MSPRLKGQNPRPWAGFFSLPTLVGHLLSLSGLAIGVYFLTSGHHLPLAASLATYLAATLLDDLSTFIALSKLCFGEGNPLVNFALSRFGLGVKGFLVAEVLLLLPLAILFLISSGSPEERLAIALTAATFYRLGGFLNIAWLAVCCARKDS